MKRLDIINEHLNSFYILHELNFGGIKSKASEIVKQSKSGNILAINRVFGSLKDIPISEILPIARRKFAKEYKDSEKVVEQKIKKCPEKIKQSLVLGRASLLKINNDTKDPDIKEKTQSSLQKIDDLLIKLSTKDMVGKGINIIGLAWLVEFFLTTTFYLATILTATGIMFIAAAIFIYITKSIIELFIDSKKENLKVIK
ncbi:MAG: hypothetical protein DRN27_07305 [Thermoplasmata archaeon]|nr:MAG: hypothetical protein DRN27_07305 [Thermoplasmata archaeon]